MAIKHWPKGEQPREKLLDKGPAALSDAELLAIFLRTGVKGKSAVELARELLTRFGGLRSLLQARQEITCATLGLGEVKYTQLQAVLELARRYLYETISRDKALSSPQETRDYLLMRMRDYSHEVFSCLFLDNKHRVIAFEDMFRGTIDSASVYPREIVKRALEHNSAALILAHNHPSGDPQPSLADKSITMKIKSALALVDIRVLDHFIVGDKECVSFAESGLL